MIIVFLSSIVQHPVSISPSQSIALYFTDKIKKFRRELSFPPITTSTRPVTSVPIFSIPLETKDELFILLRQSLSFVHWIPTLCPIKYLSCICLLSLLYYCSVFWGIIPVIKKQTNKPKPKKALITHII